MQQKHPSQSSTSEKTRSLPDIARDSTAQTAAMLDRVGMSGIETVLRRRSSEGELFLVPAKADAFVNLDDPEARGIHVSRLYLDLQRELEENEFTFPLLQKVLEATSVLYSTTTRLLLRDVGTRRRDVTTTSYPTRVGIQVDVCLLFIISSKNHFFSTNSPPKKTKKNSNIIRSRIS